MSVVIINCTRTKPGANFSSGSGCVQIFTSHYLHTQKFPKIFTEQMRKVIRSIFLLLIGLTAYLIFKLIERPQPAVPVSPENFDTHSYLQPLQFKNIINKDTGNYFNLEDQSNLKTIERNRIFTVSGFRFCKILDGATFDSLVDLKDFGSSVAEKNPDVNEFINLIDSRAYDIFQALLRKVHVAEQTVGNH